jgi:hypothetical protein
MDIKSIEPFVDCECKICGEHGVIKKNIGEYCYDCLRKYKFDYPEYIDPEQYYLFMKATLEKEFDKPTNT